MAASIRFMGNTSPMPMTKTQLMLFRALLAITIAVIMLSCARGVTPDMAANRSYKKCRPVR